MKTSSCVAANSRKRIACALLAVQFVHAGAAETRINVSTSEPVAATNQHRVIGGQCYGDDIEIRLFTKLPPEKPHATVKVGNQPEQKFDENSPFVKDFLLAPKASYQFFIFCSRDAAKTFILQAWGSSLEADAARFVQAKVIFENTGTIKQYGGPRSEPYGFIRGHMN